MRASVAAILFVAVAGLGPRIGAQDLDLDLDRLTWSELDYRARKGILTARSELRVERIGAEEILEYLVPAGDRSFTAPEGENLLLIRLRSSALGRVSEVRFWLDGLSARSFQRDERSGGSRRRYRAYRPLDAGVLRVTLRRGEGEKDRAYAEWGEREERFVPYDAELGNVAVSDPLALLLVGSMAALDVSGDVARVPVFAKDRVVWVELEVVAQEELEVSLEETPDGATRSINGVRPVLSISLTPVVDSSSGEEAEIELLGLEGDIVMKIDVETRVPLRISGRIPIAGSVNVDLERVVLR